VIRLFAGRLTEAHRERVLRCEAFGLVAEGSGPGARRAGRTSAHSRGVSSAARCSTSTPTTAPATSSGRWSAIVVRRQRSHGRCTMTVTVALTSLSETVSRTRTTGWSSVEGAGGRWRRRMMSGRPPAACLGPVYSSFSERLFPPTDFSWTRNLPRPPWRRRLDHACAGAPRGRMAAGVDPSGCRPNALQNTSSQSAAWPAGVMQLLHYVVRW
jgi:hypothetical protein